MLVSSMPNYIILLGYVIGGATRGMLVGLIVLLISYLFTSTPIEHPLLVIAMALLSAMVFSLY